MSYFNNKQVVITGAGSGLGQALAMSLAKQGAKVIATDISRESLVETKRLIHQSDHQVATHILNVTDARAIEKLLTEIPTLDIWINNAGVAASGEVRDLDLHHWKKVIDVNLFGVIFGSKLAYEKMLQQGHGQIVNIASMYGLISSPMAAAYVTSKHGVVGLTRSLRIEAKKLGVKVNLICPGFIETPLFDNGTFSGLSKDKVMGALPFPLMKLEKSVAQITNAIAKNKATTVFPFYVKTIWLLSKLCYPLYEWIGQLLLARYRKLR